MQAWCHCGWAYKTHQFLIKITSMETVLTKSSKHWVELEFIKHLHEQSYILYEYMSYVFPPKKNTFIAIYTYCTFYCSIYLLSTHFSMLKIKVTWNATVIFKQTCIVYQKTMNKQSLLLKPKQCEWPTNATRPQKLELFGQVDLVSFFGCDMVGSCFQTRFFP